MTYASFFDGFVEQLDNIRALDSARLEALRPCYQSALQTDKAGLGCLLLKMQQHEGKTSLVFFMK